MARLNIRFLTSLVLISMSLASRAERDSQADANRLYCPPVSSEEVVAATSDQGATLGIAECTERLRRFMDETLAEVRRSYKPFFEDLGADPKKLDELTRLIARQQLLSTGWISNSSLTHHQSDADAALLAETRAVLQGVLTPEELAALRKYEITIPTRELIRPIIARLESAGIPPDRANLERAVAGVQAWSVGLEARAHEEGGDDMRYCEQLNAFASRREAQLLAILAESFDERQTSVARTYYHELAEQRTKATEDYRARTGGQPCMIRQF